MIDAGVHLMLDFTDVGLSSTYRQPMSLLERKFSQLINHLTDAGSAINLVEVADGIFQGETSRLIQSTAFHSLIDAVIFAAPDAMGAAAGVSHLRNLGHNVVAVSGLLTRSPLAMREAVAATGLPILALDDLENVPKMSQLLGLGAIRDGASRDGAADRHDTAGMRPVVHIGRRSLPDHSERTIRRRVVLLAPPAQAVGDQ